MGVFSHEFATHSLVSPSRLYKAMASDFHNLLPKIVDAIHSVETIEGNGGAGTIFKVTLVEGDRSRYSFHKIEAIDEANLIYNYSVFGGTGLSETWEKITFKTIVLEGPNGGSIRNTRVKYLTKGDGEINEEVFKNDKIRADGLVKFLEGYLLENPDYK
ncbi:PREDICTED: class-10 pathogenesis-related protein 1-like [Lupinus angustifolius]|uniref:class-10 pathogenesis-related protein 1-like n=1 Tax=Lupinus angustifolius TaxID=3871 RepID=UPI00092E2371|nr:PREDICTED: class-10 pathogenesis-related protein 1-like [Lupinus angustifolius]